MVEGTDRVQTAIEPGSVRAITRSAAFGLDEHRRLTASGILASALEHEVVL